jgi:hypothetical protein
MAVQANCSPSAAPSFINGVPSEKYKGPLADDFLLSNPGGGAALLYASKELTKLSEKAANFDQKIGYQIIQNALKVRAQFLHCCRPSDRRAALTCCLMGDILRFLLETTSGYINEPSRKRGCVRS